MRMMRHAGVAIAGLALAVGGLTMVTAVEAHAAMPCAAENRAAGAAHNEAEHRAASYRKAKRKQKAAKRAYRRHHTSAGKRRLNKAQRARKRALAHYRTAAARSRAADARASRCESSAGSARPAGSSAVVDSISRALVGLGVPPDAIRQLQPALGPLGQALAGTPLDQLQPIVDQVAAALAGGVDPSLLTGVIHQITDPLTQAGIPAGTIADAIEQALAQIPTDPSQIPSDPSGLIDLVVGGVERALAGTPLDQLNPILEQVRLGLDGLLGGGAPAIPGLPF